MSDKSYEEQSENESPEVYSPIVGLDILGAQKTIEDICDVERNPVGYCSVIRQHVDRFLQLFEQLQLYVACIDEDLDIQPSGCTAELKKLQDMKRLLNLMQSPNAVLQATGRSFFGLIMSYKRLLEFEKHHNIINGLGY